MSGKKIDKTIPTQKPIQVGQPNNTPKKSGETLLKKLRSHCVTWVPVIMWVAPIAIPIQKI